MVVYWVDGHLHFRVIMFFVGMAQGSEDLQTVKLAVTISVM